MELEWNFSFSFSIQDFRSLGMDQDSALQEFAAAGNSSLTFSGALLPICGVTCLGSAANCPEQQEFTVFVNVQIYPL